MTMTSKCSTAAIRASPKLRERSDRSNEPANQPREPATTCHRAVERRRQERVHTEAAAGIRQQEEDREHDQHRVGPAPLVWHAQDADRDVGGHTDRHYRAEPRAEPE